MIQIIKSKTAINILIISFLFTLVNSTNLEIYVQNIRLYRYSDYYGNFYKSSYLRVITEKFYSLPNYIKITIRGYNSTNDYSISYYKNDSNFNERNQLSQSISGNAIMWLNKEQIKNNFYLSIECYENPCEYTLTILNIDSLELNLGEQYTYYVTEENKEMNFTLRGTPQIYYEEKNNTNYPKISIWIKGNQDIYSDLNVINNKIINKGFNSYLVKWNKYYEFNYNLTIKAKLGDLINVGFLLFSEDNICQTPIESKIEISGILLKDLMPKSCFLFDKTINDKLINLIFFKESLIFSKGYSEFNFNNRYKKLCFEMDYKNNETSNFAYSFQFNKATYRGIINQLGPHILGASYFINIFKGEILGLIPMKPENNFNYLNYQTTPIKGNYKSIILICNEYPFCQINDKSEFKNMSKIDYSYSSYFSFNNEEYDKKITPISKKQIMLLNVCEDDYCRLINNIYTDKNNNLGLYPNIPLHKYIKKNNEDKYFINLNTFNKKNNEVHWYLNLEIISGDINVNINEGTKYTYNNKILYEMRSSPSTELSITINAKQNSAYSIVFFTDNILQINKLFLMPQMNYLLKLDEYQGFNLISKMNKDNINKKVLYYFGFYPLDFKMDIKNLTSENEPNNILEANNYYQAILDQRNISDDGFKVERLNKNNKNNYDLYILSFYKYLNENNELQNIPLADNYPNSFIFNDNYKKVKYIYFHTEDDKDLNITIKSLDDIQFNLKLYINDKQYNNYNFIKDYYITLISNDIKNIPKENNQPPKINLILTALYIEGNLNNEVLINIYTINKNSNKGGEGDKKINDKRLLIILNVVGWSILIIIIIAFIIYCKKKNNSLEKLKHQVNTISFKYEDDDSNKNNNLLK